MKGVFKFDPFFPATRTFGKTLDDIFNKSIGDIVGTDFSLQSPSVNIKESDESFSIELAAPGLTKSDFSIQVEMDKLIISAEVKKESDDSDSSDTKQDYRRHEFNYSNFKRSFTLPETVDSDLINGKYENGILYVTIPKKEKAEDVIKTIEIA